MSLGRTFTLNSGYKIPAIGLGTWQSAPNKVKTAVETALKTGYRHIDAASVYGNEAEVGAGIKASGVPREEIFITSKLWNNAHRAADVEKALNKSLSDLQLTYIDLYLIHWPVGFVSSPEIFPTEPDTNLIALDNVPIKETWQALERLVEQGKVRSIGVSNFTRERIEEILAFAKIPPAINQIEAHPYLQQPPLLTWCKAQNILITAYSPLGNNIYNLPRVVDDPLVVEIASQLGKQPAQVLINWAVQRGTVVLPKSVTPARIATNFEEFVVPEEAFEKISALERKGRMNYPLRWGIDVFGEKSEEEAKKVARDWAEGQKRLKAEKGGE
ncbi:uncharacterized protein H6S33_001031 [Morchella sextelata]|uniref:uncharacterized protein n=1 Tax=Morchella sextelata TaxID=1174677 RepID=UPI001D03AEF7|nr:uncharacterized protein H6S33_001031 [Morchella sextelata]KAH0608803.1 hypothetical protein H6S33_001031 [Morchella sextelata]